MTWFAPWVRPTFTAPPSQLTGRLPPRPGVALGDVRTALALAAEAKAFEPLEDGEDEPVVETGDVNVGRAEVGAAPHRPRGVPQPRLVHVRHDVAVGGRGRSHRPAFGKDRLLLERPRPLLGGEDDRGAGVDGVVAVEEAARLRDVAGAKVVLHRQRIAEESILVEAGRTRAAPWPGPRSAPPWFRSRPCAAAW